MAHTLLICQSVVALFFEVSGCCGQLKSSGNPLKQSSSLIFFKNSGACGAAQPEKPGELEILIAS